MKYINLNMKEHGFVGHLAEPDGGSDKAVIVIMGGEKAFFRELKLRKDLPITDLSDYLYHYYDAYQDKERERKAFLPLEKTNARILMIAGGADEAWYAEHSVNLMKKYLENKNYPHNFKAVLFPNVSHLTGIMPNRECEKKLYRMIPLIGLMYRSFGKHKKECLAAFEKSEKEVINWLN